MSFSKISNRTMVIVVAIVAVVLIAAFLTGRESGPFYDLLLSLFGGG